MNDSSKTISSLEVYPELKFIQPSIQYAIEVAKQFEMSSQEIQILEDTFKGMLRIFTRNAQKDVKRRPLQIDFSLSNNKLGVKFVNSGRPMFPGQLEQYPSLVKELSTYTLPKQRSRFENAGRDGQFFSFSFFLPEMAIENIEASKSHLQTIDSVAPEEIEIRQLKAGEEFELTKLFHRVYGYNYIQDYVYYPEKLAEMIREKRLISFVAAEKSMNESNLRLIGHTGLLLNPDGESFEAALGIVDPKVKSRGTFKKLFSAVMEETTRLPMNYCLFDFVTNHDYTQKEVFKYNCHPMAIQLGSQISETQAKLESLGLGSDDKEMDRYSLLIALKFYTERGGFAKEVTLPIHLGEKLDFLLSPLGIEWTPASRFFPLPTKGSYTYSFWETQKSISFDFSTPGLDALAKLVAEWKHFLRIGYLYASVDIPLDKYGVGQVYDHLSRHGFFISGFVPYKGSGQIALRLQALGPTRVAINNIRLASETSVRLLDLISEEYERNGKL